MRASYCRNSLSSSIGEFAAKSTSMSPQQTASRHCKVSGGEGVDPRSAAGDVAEALTSECQLLLPVDLVLVVAGGNNLKKNIED